MSLDSLPKKNAVKTRKVSKPSEPNNTYTYKKNADELYNILKITNESFWVLDAFTLKLIDVNDAYCNLIGYTKDELLQMSIQDVEINENAEETKAHFKKIVKFGNDRFFTKHKTKAGNLLDIEVSATYSKAGNIIYVFLHNITEYRRKLEIEEARNRLLIFSYDHSLDDLLEQFVNEIEYITQSEIGFIHYVDEKQESLSLQNWSTRTKKEFCTVEVKGLHYPISNAGFWVDCVHNKKPVIINDYESLPNRKGMPKDHAKVIRFLTVPIFRNNVVVSIIGIGNKQTEYSDDDIITVKRFTDFIWDIVQQKRTLDQLLKREEDYRNLFDNSSAVKLIIDSENGNIVDANYAAEKFYGWNRQELKTMNARQINAISSENFSSNFSVATTQPNYHFEIQHKTANNKIIDVDVFGNKLTIREKEYLHSIIFDITERKIAENARNIEKDRAETYLNLVEVILVGFDSNANITLLNRKGYELLGYEQGELEGKNWFETCLPIEESEAVFKVYKKIISGDIAPVEYYENYVVTKTGEKRCIAWHNSFVKDRDGNITGSLSSGEDITLRKTAEQSLYNNEKILNAIFENSQDAIGISKNGVFIWLNKTFLNLFGYSEDESIGMPVAMCISPKEQERVKEIIRKRNAGEYAPSFYETIGLRKNGEEFPYEIKAGLYEINNEKYTMTVVRDITLRKKSEKLLHESEERLKRSEIIANIGHWFYNRSDKKFHISDGAAKIYGFDRNIVTIEELRKSWLPEYEELIETSFNNLINNNIPYKIEVKIKRINDGEIIDIISTTEFDSDTNIVFGTIQDITERKHAEAEKSKMMEDIVKRNKDLEQFSYIISHNLRSPLANILSISEMLQSDENSEDDQQFLLSSIKSAATKLDMVVQDINNVLYVKNQISEQKQPVKFSEILKENIGSLQTQILKESVFIDSDFTEVNEFVTIKSYLHSVFHNLISNSIKYRRENVKPIIEIKSKKYRNKIILIFKDNGIGIDTIKAGKSLFGLYKRFHSHVEGKGMGLYMVKSQIETLGGSISIKSEINKGTEFIIEFNI